MTHSQRFLDTYKQALKELKDNGFCNKNFDPIRGTSVYYHVDDNKYADGFFKGFLLYRKERNDIKLEFTYIVPAYRKKGEAKKMVKAFIKELRHRYPQLELRFIADIADDNIASVKTFLNIGFVEGTRNYVL